MTNMILSISALSISIVALIIGCVALAFVIGLSRSTHQVVWKEANPKETDEIDPFQVPDDFSVQVNLEENPNKRIKKKEDDSKVKEESFEEITESSGF